MSVTNLKAVGATPPVVVASEPSATGSEAARPRESRPAEEKSPRRAEAPSLVGSDLLAEGQAMVLKDGPLHQPVILVIDKATGRVVREIPPAEVRKVLANLEVLRGLFFDSVT
ncbi:MAG: flagellar protein FlaG [Myxococcales bacterium]|nr:flagellar protein FlaG [Myxococcales bacterium]